MIVDVRRRYVSRCNECNRYLIHIGEDRGATKDRAEYDWTRPLPDQYPSVSRKVLRSFVDNGDEELVVECADVPTLMGTIRALGFADDVYAEQRANLTVLRRIRKESKPC